MFEEGVESRNYERVGFGMEDREKARGIVQGRSADLNTELQSRKLRPRLELVGAREGSMCEKEGSGLRWFEQADIRQLLGRGCWCWWWC